MKRFGLFLIGVLVFVTCAWAVNYGGFPPPVSSGGGIAYSPEHFTATVISPTTFEAGPSNKLSLSGGNTANYVTAECLRITVFPVLTTTEAANGVTKTARIYDPTQNQFIYTAPTLEVKRVLFGTQESFRVEFAESPIAAHSDVTKVSVTTGAVSITFTQIPKFFEAVNYDATDVLYVQTEAGQTWEVAPSIGPARKFTGLNCQTIEVYGSGNLTAEIGAMY